MKRLLNGIAVLGIVLLALSAASASAGASWQLGEPVAVPSGEITVRAAVTNRTIAITEGTRWVNVTHYEVVRFTSEGREFIWYFDGLAQPGPFDLAKIAPAGFVDHRVTVYISPASIDLSG